jgi:hypothetical protein
MQTAFPVSFPADEQGDPSVAILKRLAIRRAAEERCELCRAPMAPAHRHLLDLEARLIICACDACALRFQDARGGRFKLIPREARGVPGFAISETQWDDLALPINLVFFYLDSRSGEVAAIYPGAAGAMESRLPPANWEALRIANPALAKVEPDVEALLVNRIGAAREYFITPIDLCYELVGLLRLHWRGLSGGEIVWHEIEKFFAKLREQTDLPIPNPAEACHARP